MEAFLQTETVIIELLLIASLVAILVQRIKLPYTVALVLVGLGLTLVGSIRFDLTEELILALFLPPLLFEAAFHVEFNLLRKSLRTVVTMAVLGVLLSTFIVGGLVAVGTSLSLVVALVFGALIVATDPVAVTAIFSSLGAPKKLAIIVEGESLFNDGAAVVLFNILLGVALTGHFNLVEGLGEFVWVSAAGIGLGLGLGWIAVQIIARIDNYLIETSITTVLAYGAYLVAEEFHVSGVLAVVTAGILNGNIGPRGMSATTKIVLFNFWEYLAFLSNSLVFLLIGLEVELDVLATHIGAIIVAYIAVSLARLVSVYGLSWLLGRLPASDELPLVWQHVLVWGGLRGAVSLALALGLSPAMGSDRELILSMTFGVVLIMLLLQATTMEWLLKRLKLIGRPEIEAAYEYQRGELLTLRAARQQLDMMHERGELSAHAWDILEPELDVAESQSRNQLRQLVADNPTLEVREIVNARRELLQTRRGLLNDLQRDGMIDEETFEKLATEIDQALDELEQDAH